MLEILEIGGAIHSLVQRIVFFVRHILIHFNTFYIVWISVFHFHVKTFCHLLCPLVLFHSARGLNGSEIVVLVSALGEACKFFANALDSSSWNAEKAIRNDWRDLERFRTVPKWLAFVETTVLLPPVFVGNVDRHEPDEQQFEINCRDAKWKTYMGHNYWGLLCCSVSRSSSRKDNLWHPVCFISFFLQRS